MLEMSNIMYDLMCKFKVVHRLKFYFYFLLFFFILSILTMIKGRNDHQNQVKDPRPPKPNYMKVWLKIATGFQESPRIVHGY